MSRFYQKNWFPYIFPFLLCFTIAQATTYLPSWRFHLSTAQVLLGAGLLWVWRQKYVAEVTQKISVSQGIISSIWGILGFSMWIAAQHFHLITFKIATIPSQWPAILVTCITALILSGSIIILPIISEIFWRSFMLRYLIVQDFQSIPLGHFQFFSFIVVILLTALPSEYAVAVALTSMLQNILIVWQKNLRCCIVSSVVTHSLLAIYLSINHYQLF